MICPRCNSTMGEPVDYWVKCPACSLSRYVGISKAVSEKVETEQEGVKEEEEEKNE